MKKIVLSLSVFGLLIACTSEQQKESQEMNASYDVEIVTVDNAEAAKVVANLSIEGMSCEHSCVAAINKELKSLVGVENVEIDFETGRDLNIASVTFNPDQINHDGLAKAVNEIGGGDLYNTTLIKVEEYKLSEDRVEEEIKEDIDGTDEEGTVKTSIVNLLDIFQSLKQLI